MVDILHIKALRNSFPALFSHKTLLQNQLRVDIKMHKKRVSGKKFDFYQKALFRYDFSYSGALMIRTVRLRVVTTRMKLLVLVLYFEKFSWVRSDESIIIVKRFL